MSADYMLSLVYGVIVKESDKKTTHRLIEDYGNDKEAHHTIYADIDEKLSQEYSLLNIAHNFDQMSGEFEKAVVIYAKSSYINLNMKQETDVQKLSPIRINELGYSSDEVDQLNEFAKKYGIAKTPSWIIVGAIF